MQERLTSILFDRIEVLAGYAIPNANFWEMWNSEQKDALIRARFIPQPRGYEFNESSKWIVLLPHVVPDYVSVDRY